MSDFMIKNFYKQRKDFEKSSAERNLTLTFPDTVTEIKNIPGLLPSEKTGRRTSPGNCKCARRRTFTWQQRI